MFGFVILLSVFTSVSVYADYDCVCNYAVETGVFSTPDAGGQPVGYLYEFDCKPKASSQQDPANFYTVQFEKKLGYVETGSQVRIQTCPGNPPGEDLIPAAITTTAQSGTKLTTLDQTTGPVNTAGVTTASTTSPTTQTTTLSAQTFVTKTTTSFKSTTPYGYWLLAANVTGTPLQFIGIGYNILTGNPEVSPDPGLKTAPRIFELSGNASSVREATSSVLTTCTPTNGKAIIHGSKSYQDELLKFVQPSSGHYVRFLDSALTYSSAFQSFKPTVDNVTNYYLDYISSCKLGTARYKTELADKNNFTITREFARDVCALPTDSNSTVEYRKFLDKWGTSIVTYVETGTWTIQRYQTTPDQILQHAQQKAPELVEHTGTGQSYHINLKDFINSPAASVPFGTHQALSIGSKQQPVPIAVKVTPILDALNWNYWEPIVPELMAEGICSDSIYGTDMKHYASFIQAALNQYAAQTGVTHSQLTDHGIDVTISSWPAGTYGLMQTSNGCPGGTPWLSGWRKQDTEDLNAKNSFSGNINHYLKGEFADNNIKTYFCIKNSARTDQHDPTWQKGAYCLLKHGACPQGFTTGYISWDDEDLSNSNSRGGTLPDGTYDKNTKMYYCCRNDGSPQTPLSLPTGRPFVLLRYGRTCQSVHGMRVQDIYIHWDDEDLRNKDSAGGMHPLDDGNSHNHQLHYCYYSSAAGPSLIG